MRHLVIFVVAADRLGGIDIVPRFIDQIIVIGIGIVGDGEIGIIGHILHRAVEIGARIGQVPIADLALHGHRGEIPIVDILARREIVILQIARARIIQELALGVHMLVDDARRHRPVIVEIDQQRGAAAIIVDVVIVLLDERRIVDGERRILDDRVAVGIGAHRMRPLIGARGIGIVDIAAVMFVVTDQADRDILVQGNVDEPLGGAAGTALAELVALEIVSALELARIGLVGDDAQGARQRTGAVERALRARQRLDARQIIGMQVDRAEDRRDRGLVDIEAAARQRARSEAVAAGGDAAEIELRLAGAERLVAHARQQLGDIGEGRHLMLLQGRRRQRLHADRHVLQAFRTLGRGDDDVARVDGRIGRGRICPADGLLRCSGAQRQDQCRRRQKQERNGHSSAH